MCKEESYEKFNLRSASRYKLLAELVFGKDLSGVTIQNNGKCLKYQRVTKDPLYEKALTLLTKGEQRAMKMVEVDKLQPKKTVLSLTNYFDSQRIVFNKVEKTFVKRKDNGQIVLAEKSKNVFSLNKKGHVNFSALKGARYLSLKNWVSLFGELLRCKLSHKAALCTTRELFAINGGDWIKTLPFENYGFSNETTRKAKSLVEALKISGGVNAVRYLKEKIPASIISWAFEYFSKSKAFTFLEWVKNSFKKNSLLREYDFLDLVRNYIGQKSNASKEVIDAYIAQAIKSGNVLIDFNTSQSVVKATNTLLGRKQVKEIIKLIKRKKKSKASQSFKGRNYKLPYVKRTSSRPIKNLRELRDALRKFNGYVKVNLKALLKGAQSVHEIQTRAGLYLVVSERTENGLKMVDFTSRTGIQTNESEILLLKQKVSGYEYTPAEIVVEEENKEAKIVEFIPLVNEWVKTNNHGRTEKEKETKSRSYQHARPASAATARAVAQ